MSATLVINAPWQKVQDERKRSFDDTFRQGVGDEYAIPSTLIARLGPGCKVVLLCKDKKRRAEGILVELVPRSKTDSGMQRYDVQMKLLEEVSYKSERLRRTGVAVLWN